MRRRDFIGISAASLLGAAGLPRDSRSQGKAPNAQQIRPTWLSFGVNGPAMGATRFPLTMAMSNARASGFQLQVTRAIGQQLKTTADVVDFNDAVDINSGVMLGAVLDYENVLAARLGGASFVVLHLVGHGVLLNFDRSRGWKMISSFPFPVTLLRESKSGDTQAEASRYLLEAYVDAQNSFATSFAKAAKRLAPKWRDSDRGFNVRFMSSTIHPEVAQKLAAWGIAKSVNDVWLGHLASAAACEGLGIPIVPYGENQALGKFTYKFSEQLVAQNVRLPEEADIDIRLHVVFRNIVREVKFRTQYQRWEVVRAVVMDVKAVDDQNREIVAFRMGYQDDQPDTLAREEDLVPARDAHFFDMAIYRGLQTLFSAIDRQDKAQLARVFVKPDAEQQGRIDRFRNQYQRAI
jgi:hypothetical protein